MIVLDEKSANELNDLLEYADSLPVMQKFNIGHYTLDVLGNQTNASYAYYTALIMLVRRLMRKYDAKWLLIDEIGDMWASWETRAFLDQGGFLKVLEMENEETRLNQNIIRTNNASYINIIATILFGLIVTTIQIMTCNRETKRESQEVQKQRADSIKQARQEAHDSLYGECLLRKTKEIVDSSQKGKTASYTNSTYGLSHQAERVYKSYPLTRILAWVGAINGGLTLLLKVAELLGWLPSKK